MGATGSQVSAVGELMREWRRARGMSQLDLALEAEISSKHLSFVETGRAQPGRDMVLRLATSLDLPLRERNALLTAAGYAPIFRERDLDAPDMAPVSRALDLMLDHHEPFPALIADRLWNIVRQNRSSRRMFEMLVGEAQAAALRASGPPNLLRLAMQEQFLRPCIVNWNQVASTLLTRFRREVFAGRHDAALHGLLEELLATPGVPERWQSLDLEADVPPVLPVIVRKDDVTLSLFTTLSTFGTPQDVGLQELRIESYFPMDVRNGSILQKRRPASPRPDGLR